MTLDDLWGHALFIENLRLYMDILYKFQKDWALNKKYNALKDDFEILRWPFVTFNGLWGHTSLYEKL